MGTTQQRTAPTETTSCGPASDYEEVEFPSSGVTLRGRLYRGDSLEKPGPAVVMTLGFTATISGMTADRYAEAFAAAGLVVLLYDHHGFGVSDGEPRHEVDAWLQTRGYMAAVSYLSSLPDVDADRIAVWGVSFSGALALVVAAVDERVAAVVAQVPACGDEMPEASADDGAFTQFRDTLLHADLGDFERKITGPLPVVSPDQLQMPSLMTSITAFRWFIDKGGRYGSRWENRATVARLETPVSLDPGLCAPHIRVPTMVVTARHDEIPGCDADVARSVLALVRGPKESLVVDGGHFGALYPDSQEFAQSIEAQPAFLLRHLGRQRSSA